MKYIKMFKNFNEVNNSINMNVGSIVICIDTVSPFGDILLTYQKEYEIIEVLNEYFKIKDDIGNSRNYLKSRFKLSLVNRRRKFINENIK